MFPSIYLSWGLLCRLTHRLSETGSNCLTALIGTPATRLGRLLLMQTVAGTRPPNLVLLNVMERVSLWYEKKISEGPWLSVVPYPPKSSQKESLPWWTHEKGPIYRHEKEAVWVDVQYGGQGKQRAQPEKIKSQVNAQFYSLAHKFFLCTTFHCALNRRRAKSPCGAESQRNDKWLRESEATERTELS